jgi:hypothetical protein
MVQAFFEQVLTQVRERDLLSDEHFAMDGTPSEARASQKSFKRKESVPPSLQDDSGSSVLTSARSDIPTPPGPRPQILRLACTKKPQGRKSGHAIWDTYS